jgi:hypothetical protein
MNMKNFSVADIGFTKLATAAVVLLLVSSWPGFASWAMNTHWAWFLGAAIVFGIKPLMTVFSE